MHYTCNCHVDTPVVFLLQPIWDNIKNILIFCVYSENSNKYVFYFTRALKAGMKSPALMVYTSTEQRERYKDAFLVAVLGAMEAAYVVSTFLFLSFKICSSCRSNY